LLATLLRAEPFARVAHAPRTLEEELDALIAGKGLVTEGLVADLDREGAFTMTSTDGDRVTGRTCIFDSFAALEDLYASKEMLAPGEVYNRLHSHSGSEELYIILEGEGAIRVNERVLPIRAGQCFGKPRGYGCSTQ